MDRSGSKSCVALACLLLLSSSAVAATESRRSATIIDVESGRPLPVVLFSVQQHHRVPRPIHGSSSSCVRHGAAIGRDGKAGVVLPEAGVDLLSRIRGESSERVFAHSPGHCTLPEWREQGGVSTFRARRNVDPPEQRILYLREVLGNLPRVCEGAAAEGTEAALRAIADEIIAEARAAATSPYEEELAQRMTRPALGTLVEDSPASSNRAFAIVDDNQPPAPIQWNQPNRSCRRTGSELYPARIGEPHSVPPPPRYRVVCRDSSDCDFERRRSNGLTYLAELIGCFDPDRVAALLAAGANPDARRYPGGPNGVDALLGTLLQARGPAFDRAIQTLDLVVADGRATLGTKTRETWRQRAERADSEAAAWYARVVALLDRLPDRPLFRPVCPVQGEINPALR